MVVFLIIAIALSVVRRLFGGFGMFRDLFRGGASSENGRQYRNGQTSGNSGRSAGSTDGTGEYSRSGGRNENPDGKIFSDDEGIYVNYEEMEK